MEKECLDLLKQIRNMHNKHPRDIENIIDALYWEYDCEKLTTNKTFWNNNTKYYKDNSAAK